jgi:hypothetical protein
MDYHSLTFQDLKKVARDHKPKIKQYYIKSRHELIQLLTMPVLPQQFIIEKMTIQELRDEARARGHKAGLWKLLRAELVELLYPSPDQNNKNNDSGKKHDPPNKTDSD